MNKKKALIIGLITVTAYIANYFLRNMLGVLTPYIIKSTSCTKEYLAMLSSVYMIAYAAGQLLNGVLGDIFKPKAMVLAGLLAAGASSALFPFAPHGLMQIICFLILGYALSMMRGPLMKIISENTKPDYARVICVFFSFAGFAGPLTASLIAMIFNWNAAFLFAGTVSAAIGICAYAAISVLEKKGMITFKKMKEITFSEMLAVFKINRFPFFLTIACLVEIAGMSISFWIPTFLNEYINLPASESNLVFSFISLVRALIPFAALALFKLFGGRDTLIMKYAYGISFAAFLCMLFVPKGILTVAFLLLVSFFYS